MLQISHTVACVAVLTQPGAQERHKVLEEVLEKKPGVQTSHVLASRGAKVPASHTSHDV